MLTCHIMDQLDAEKKILDGYITVNCWLITNKH